MYSDYDNQDPASVEKPAFILQQLTCITKSIENKSAINKITCKKDMSRYKQNTDSSGGGGGSNAHYIGALSGTDIGQPGPTQAPSSSQAGSAKTKNSFLETQAGI